jgi:hypothetical protein
MVTKDEFIEDETKHPIFKTMADTYLLMKRPLLMMNYTQSSQIKPQKVKKELSLTLLQAQKLKM